MWTNEHFWRTFNFYIDRYVLVNILSDIQYLKWKFKKRTGYTLNIENPKTFCEKLQWLKLESKNHPEYTQMVDKATAKDYVAAIVGDKYIIPTYGIWNSINEIDWKALPNQFVVKSTGDSGGVVICKDKTQFDINSAINKLKNTGARDYAKFNKEYPYKSVVHRYIAEEYMEDESGYELKDYKIFCFDGCPKFLKVDFDRHTYHRANYYDLNWNLLPFYEKDFPQDSMKYLARPDNFELMLEIASKLSKNIPFVRIDLYNIKGKIYFGEITFFPASGMGQIEPVEWDLKLGNMIDISKI